MMIIYGIWKIMIIKKGMKALSFLCDYPVFRALVHIAMYQTK